MPRMANGFVICAVHNPGVNFPQQLFVMLRSSSWRIVSILQVVGVYFVLGEGASDLPIDNREDPSPERATSVRGILFRLLSIETASDAALIQPRTLTPPNPYSCPRPFYSTRSVRSRIVRPSFYVTPLSYVSVCICIYLNVSCLLYTSPSPRDKRQSRMPSSA